jgi:hypothetical protein
VTMKPTLWRTAPVHPVVPGAREIGECSQVRLVANHSVSNRAISLIEAAGRSSPSRPTIAPSAMPGEPGQQLLGTSTTCCGRESCALSRHSSPGFRTCAALKVGKGSLV